MKLKHALVEIRTDDALKNIYSNAVPAANGNDISQSSYTETLSRQRKPVLQLIALGTKQLLTHGKYYH